MISVDGLITGFDTSKIIDELLEVQRRPLKLVEAQQETEAAKQSAYGSILAKLLGLQTTASKLGDPDLFSRTQVTSSDPSVLVASGSSDLAPGSYTFVAAQLARTSQLVSSGFATSDETGLGAGTLTIEIGRGYVDRKTSLDDLNGGQGVSRGKIVITDRSGKSALVDLSNAVTISDVIDAINSASGVSVQARIAGASDTNPGEAIVIEDTSGGTGTLSVSDLGGGTTARDLGIRSSTTSSTLQGEDIISITESTRLSSLNDGNGVAFQAGNDITITQKNGSSFSVDLSSATTIGDVISTINNASGNDGVTVSIASDGNRLVVTDTTAPSGTTTISEVEDGRAARDLGILGSFTTASSSGERLIAGLNTVLLRELKGGSGITSGSIRITDRAGNSATVDLSSAETLQEVIDAINNTAGISVEASVNSAGDGLRITDTSGGTGTLTVEEVGGGSTASDLGILAASGVSGNVLEGEDLKIRYISPTTRLDTLNAGRGVSKGSIRITDTAGRSFTVDLSQEETVADVIEDINGAATLAGSDVVADINSDGNGIILTSSAGSGTLRVDEVEGGTTAADLGIAGSAPSSTPGVLNGSFEHSITITDDMTLEELKDEIDDLDLPLNVAIVHDGTSDRPYRLFVAGTEGGQWARVILHTYSDTDLSFSRTADAQDAVLLVGGTGGGSPVVVRSNTNTFEDVVPGMTVTLVGTSSEPVNISATNDDEKIYDVIEDFVQKYNDLVDDIADLTRYDTETEEAGLLLGDGALRTALNRLSAAITKAVTGNPTGLNMAAHVGIRIGPKGKLIFDRTKLEEKLLENRRQVKALFTSERQLEESTPLSDFRNGQGVRIRPGQADFKIWTRDGSSFEVDLTGADTVWDVLHAINNASGNSSVTASISSDGRSLVLTDSSTGSSTFRVSSLNGSSADNDLGINRSADTSGGDTITGDPIDLSGDWGIGKRLVDALESMVNADTGSIQLRYEDEGKRIDELKKRAEELKERIARQEELLRRQFAQLEVIMGQQQNTMQRLTAMLSTLPFARRNNR